MIKQLEKAVKKKLIHLDDDKKYITYLNENKRRNYSNPEEKIQAQTFFKLIFDYNYSPSRIRQFVPVTMGSETKEADIVIYNDDACTKPHIVVECKKQNISELEFKQAVNQGFAYAYALAGTIKYVWVTSGIKNEYYQVDKERDVKQTVSDVPQYGISKLSNYRYAKGGGIIDGQKLFKLEVVTEDELTRRFKLAHQSLWGGGELNPSEAFDELDKLIFCKIWDERKPRKKGRPYDFQLFTEAKQGAEKPEATNARADHKLLRRIKDLYEEGRKKDKEVFKDNIRLSAQKCSTVVKYLEGIDLNKTDLDSKGRAFETFMGSFFRGDFGQYFTPRPIVKFIVNVLPITNDSVVPFCIIFSVPKVNINGLKGSCFTILIISIYRLKKKRILSLFSMMLVCFQMMRLKKAHHLAGLTILRAKVERKLILRWFRKLHLLLPKNHVLSFCGSSSFY